MSLHAFEKLLRELNIKLDSAEKRRIYRMVLKEFGIKDGRDFESRMEDGFERDEIEKYIREILKLERIKRKDRGIETFL